MEIKFTDELPIHGRAFRAPAPLDALVHLASPMYQELPVPRGTVPLFTGHYWTCLGILTMGNARTKSRDEWETWIVDEPITCLECLVRET
jgi:hypothetical protein